MHRLSALACATAASPPAADMPFDSAPAECAVGEKRKAFLPPFVLPSRLERGVDILHDPVFNKARDVRAVQK